MRGQHAWHSTRPYDVLAWYDFDDVICCVSVMPPACESRAPEPLVAGVLLVPAVLCVQLATDQRQEIMHVLPA